MFPPRVIRLAALSFLLGLTLLCSFSVHGQQATSTSTRVISGVVRSQADGDAISGARIVATDAAGHVAETNSDSDGSFRISGLDISAAITLQIKAIGFTEETRTVADPSTDATPISIALKIDPLQASITVFSEAPLVKTTPELARTLDTKTVEELPSSTRNLAQFALLDPRARNTVGSGSDGRAATRLAINNQSFRFTQYLLDGSSNFDFIFSNGPQQNISLAAVGEFKLLTNQYSAQYGRSSGGVVLVSTKAGTDQYHGEAFAFVRPSGIQAAPPVSTRHIPNEREIYGGLASGPILSGKTYFLGSFEGSLQNRGAFIQSPVPTFFNGHQNSWMALGRIDHKWSDRQLTTLRVNGDYLRSNNLNDSVGGFVQPDAARIDVQQSASAQLTQRSIFASWLNDFRFSYANALPLWYKPIVSSISIVRPQYATTGTSAQENVRTQSFHISDVVTKTWHSHSLTYGGDYLKQYTNNNFIGAALGTYTFKLGDSPTSTKPISYTQTVGSQLLQYGQDLMSAFVQDDWRVSSRLTANLGLRYDYQSITAGRTNLSPRLGVAWDAYGDGRTIVRVGAGIFYDQVYGQIQRNALNQGPNSPTATYTVQNPSYPTPPVLTTAVPRDLYLLDPNMLNPYAMEASAGVQQVLPGNFVMTIDAVYMGSRHLLQFANLNAPAPFIRTVGSPATRTAAAANATRKYSVYPGTTVAVANVEQIVSVGTARNLSGELQISRRFLNRFQMQAAYLYGSNTTNTFLTGGLSTGTPQVWGVATGEYAPSDFYQRHRLVATGILELPYALRLSGTTVAGSGLPVNPLTGIDNDGDGIMADRPVGFARNSFRGPLQSSVDVAITRTFHVFERLNVETRVEGFNVLNHNTFVKLATTYGTGVTPSNSFLTPQAGIQNSDPSRQIQFATRVLF
jgi:Carboxypeptidase regulatory-like domain